MLKKNILFFINESYLNLKKYLNFKIKIERDQPNMLNLGCGLEVHKNFINIDSSPHAFISKMPNFIKHIFYNLSEVKNYYSKDQYISLLEKNEFFHFNVADNIPVKNESIDAIYSSHLLEHLEKDIAIKLLEESYRVLKKKGIIRISIPDLDIASKLLNTDDNEKILKKFFYTFENGNEFSRHRFMYNFTSIKKILLKCGYSQVNRCSFKKGMLEEAFDLDNREEESLFLEAIK